MKITDLKENPNNPRKITIGQEQALKKSLLEFGDLSGIVFNRRTKQLVGGHQRCEIFTTMGDRAKLKITSRKKKPSQNGTVAEGYVVLDGERFVYREVEWTEEKERIANIAANKHGGDWDNEKLREIIKDFDASDYSLAGFDNDEIERFAFQATDQNEPESESEETELQESGVRMVQLFLTTETHPIFAERMANLATRFGTTNITETVLEALRRGVEK